MTDLRSVGTDDLITELMARITHGAALETGVRRDQRALDKVLEGLVAMYPAGRPGALVFDLMRVAEIGCAYIDREMIESHLEVRFTDEQWTEVAWHLDSFDEWLSWGTQFAEFYDHVVDAAGLRVVENTDPDAETEMMVVPSTVAAS